MKTKKILNGLIGAFLIAMLSIPTAQAVLLYTEDTKLGETTLANSSLANEEAWFEGLTGFDLVLDFKVDNGTGIQSNDGGGGTSWFLDIAPEQPGFFLLKFGGAGLNENTHYAFQNIAELTKLVWSDDAVNALTSTSITSLSHYTAFNGEDPGDPGEVPEPATLLLFGGGLAGIAFMRRRKKI